ncbi:GtrA family protein [Prosthecomicrobium sp. N25]|uniref:GtrA family protein n=1 Tax=Prosthecomicrobium sp. N25 TaxID=3129254 RepID=UPI003077548B
MPVDAARRLIRSERDLGQFLRFATVGAITTVIDIVGFALLVTVLPPAPANLCSYSMGLTVSYLLNSRWTFGVSRNPAQAVKFVAATLAGLGLSTLLVASLSLVIPPIVAKVLSVPVVFAWNYLTVRFWVFRA